MRHRDIIDVNAPQRPFFDAIAADATEAITTYVRKGCLGEALNYQRQIITALEAIIGDTIGTAWRKAVRAQFRNPRAATRWKANALNLNPDDPHLSIALNSMAAMKVDDAWHLAVPLPLPCPLGPKFAEPEEIVLIHSQTGEARIYSDDGPALIKPLYMDRFTVHADARVWAREIATAAIEWFYNCENARKVANIIPDWTGYAPSALAIGAIDKIRWPHITTITAGTGIDAAQLKKTIFKQARITHVEAPFSVVRAA